MGKRSNFERNERDYYKTPQGAITPLLPFLDPNFKYIEPCAGDGALIWHLPNECVLASDIEPQVPWIDYMDVFSITPQIADDTGANLIITNPPWDRKILHPLIEHLSIIRPTWLLFDADWAHTKQSSQYMPWCTDIVAVGRVKWIEGSKHTGKDNCCWYRFDQNRIGWNFPTIFHGR